MEQHIGKKCKIHILKNEKNLFYTAIVNSVTLTHITFTDKYETSYTFPVDEIKEIAGVEKHG